MKGYKGFAPGLVCRGKQYAENTVFEEDTARICHSGMHFCENPFDVLDHYDLVNGNGEFNDFAEVEALDPVHTDDKKKYCTTRLRIGAKLSFAGFVKACVDFLIEKTKISVDAGSSGYGAQIGSSGYGAKIGSSGYGAQIGSSGDGAQIGSSGYGAQIGSSGKDSVICCSGIGSKVKAKKGSWITLSEWEYSEEKGRYVPVCVKTEFVDGERIKEDTLYMLKNGEFVEV
mgnify:CR=1 FL=1